VQKQQKDSFFVLFADFSLFASLKKPKIHYLVGPPQNPMWSGKLKTGLFNI
jgi:hypothetical protein